MRRSRVLNFLLIVVMVGSAIASFLTYSSVQQMHSEMLYVLAAGKEDSQQQAEADGAQKSSSDTQEAADAQAVPAKAVLKSDPSLPLEEEERIEENLVRLVIGQDQEREIDLDGDGKRDTISCERDEEGRLAVETSFSSKELSAFSIHFSENGASWARVMSLDLGDGTRTLVIAAPAEGDGSGERRLLVSGMCLADGEYTPFSSESGFGDPLSFVGWMEEDTAAYIEAEATNSAQHFCWDACALNGQVKKGDAIDCGYIWDVSYREKEDGRGYYMEYWQEVLAGEGVLLGYGVTVTEVDVRAGTQRVVEQCFVPVQGGKSVHSDGGETLAFAEEEIIEDDLVSLYAGMEDERRVDLDGDGKEDGFLCDVNEEGNIYAQMKFSMDGVGGHTSEFVMDGAQGIRLLSLDLGDGNRTLVVGARREDAETGERALLMMGLRFVDGKYILFPEGAELGRAMDFAGRMESDTVAKIELNETGEEQKFTLEKSLLGDRIKKGDTILFNGLCEVSFQKKENGRGYNLKYWQEGRTENGVLMGYGVTVVEADPQDGTQQVVSQFFVPQMGGTEVN